MHEAKTVLDYLAQPDSTLPKVLSEEEIVRDVDR
jgi:hypothetical protein